ncbi:uncharacterized protein DNG_01832 [Cephalotrichum gorgonifer]|uniref:Protein kinase domain-containing protein n=1 Tax=Cephalotrichum gorgonifer TaxID=2041049 RepID=A0AAE8MRD5_9PEZI|nr:uncharacterized protein DNG_01832 [Cephalotrichum gorgonifer]
MSLEHVTYDASATDSAGRCPGTHKARDGTTAPLVLEWISSMPIGLAISLVQLRDELSTNKSPQRRPEEVRTLPFAGIHLDGREGRAALAYELLYLPTNLRDVLVGLDKPMPEDRCVLAGLVATQVRSLHVHFRNKHMALRTESFVFLWDDATTGPASSGKRSGGGGLGALDLREPYLLDWGRESLPSVYQHPDYDPSRKLWYYDVWSLMMVISEIAEWKPIEVSFRDERDLLRRKLDRRRLVTDVAWRGESTANVFRYGFDLLDRKRSTLDTMSWSSIKMFFDGLCELLDADGMPPVARR